MAAGLRVHPNDPAGAAAFVGLNPADLGQLTERARAAYAGLIAGDTNALVQLADSALIGAFSHFLSRLAETAPGMMPTAISQLAKMRALVSGNAPASFSAFKLVLVDHDGAELDLTPEPDRKAG